MRNGGSKPVGGLAVAVGVLLLPLLGAAQRETPDDRTAVSRGAATYATYCASCHGKWGEGDGPLAAQLGTPPSDLTRLSKRNGDKYPFDKVHRIIDGRRAVKAHGAMPAWGDALRESRDDDEQGKVSERITELTRFLASIQEAPGPAIEDSASAWCVFSNASVSGRCTETADVAKGSSPHDVCEEILRCLNSERCIDTYCRATTIRLGWKLDSASAGRRPAPD